jgi:hypothetical protein
LLALFGAAIALTNGGWAAVPLVVFMMTFSSVQLVEFLLWKFADPAGNPSDVNRWLSMAMCAVLALEPVASIGLLDDPSSRRRWMAAYSALVVAAGVYFWIYGASWRTTVAGNGHLQWLWLPFGPKANTHHGFGPKETQQRGWVERAFGVAVVVAWIFFLVAPLFWARSSRWVFWYGLATLAISVACWARGGTIATMWCWLSALGWLVVIGAAVMSSASGEQGGVCKWF